MGHWAKIEDDRVVQVVVADDDKQDWLTETLGGVWVQTSYNTRGGVHYDPETGEPSVDQSKALRGNYASVGLRYLADVDLFVPPKPFESWVLDLDCACWVAPVDMPDDGQDYVWDESAGEWVAVPEPTE